MSLGLAARLTRGHHRIPRRLLLRRPVLRVRLSLRRRRASAGFLRLRLMGRMITWTQQRRPLEFLTANQPVAFSQPATTPINQVETQGMWLLYSQITQDYSGLPLCRGFRALLDTIAQEEGSILTRRQSLEMLADQVRLRLLNLLRIGLVEHITPFSTVYLALRLHTHPGLVQHPQQTHFRF